ncbi:hypothetical protein IWQ60_007689 [Tieghemiomyces parasiticus]|uniref:Uncharacterized protein n=1 Tax=Tieghemiomyces parasiticus TaxID=78921 RepID=A0A9W8DTZ7_9FUNG|nr:hypothetical protein IWQ60_007689 [Tieghemiomyces parasiticus]
MKCAILMLALATAATARISNYEDPESQKTSTIPERRGWAAVRHHFRGIDHRQTEANPSSASAATPTETEQPLHANPLVNAALRHFGGRLEQGRGLPVPTSNHWITLRNHAQQSGATEEPMHANPTANAVLNHFKGKIGRGN